MNNFEISNLKSEILPLPFFGKATLGRLLTIALATLLPAFAALAQSTAFTYQGRLNHAGYPATGLYEITLTVYDSATNGNVIATPVTLGPVPVTNGLFTATLDFGPDAFTGPARWLEISVTVFGSDQPVITLTPRQPITPVPYAIHAANAAGLMSFINAPLDIKVNGQRILRLEPATGSPNIIGGSSANQVSPGVIGAFIGGGSGHHVTGEHGTIAGGSGNTTSGGSFIGGGSLNLTENAASSAIGGGFRNVIRSEAHTATIGGGIENTIQTESINATISGGGYNSIGSEADGSTIGGGAENLVEGIFVTLNGGLLNSSRSHFSTIGGGVSNTIHSYAFHGTIAGGAQNEISEFDGTGLFAFIGGGFSNRVHANGATIAGGMQNIIDFADGGTIAGGSRNHCSGDDSTIGGGRDNGTGGGNCTVAGGLGNSANAHGATVGGGRDNSAYEEHSTIAGGYANSCGGEYGTVGGGQGNDVYAVEGTVGGGFDNRVYGEGATIPGGFQNRAEGARSFAAGSHAHALHHGAFVWADGAFEAQALSFISTTNNEFSARTIGGVRFVTAIDTNGTPTAGVSLAPGSGTWSSLSDRNAKENFTPTQPREVLEKVTALPIATWNYKSQDKSIRHIGPTAQDFHAAFNVGENDRTITTVDADGVALAAIQGLNQKLEHELKTKDAQIRQLQSDLAEVKQLLRTLANR